jgi:hypothetical protein
MALKNAMRVGSKFLSRAAVISTGKYGIGINTITLDIKLNKTIPRYSSSRPKVKKFSMITNDYTYILQVSSNIIKVLKCYCKSHYLRIASPALSLPAKLVIKRETAIIRFLYVIVFYT